MKKSLLVLAMASAFFVEDTARAAVAVKYDKTSDWKSAFIGQFTLTNPDGNEVKDWQLEFDLPYTITNMWGARISSRVGNHYVVVPESWSKVIRARGGSAVVGFQANPGNAANPTNVVFTPISSGGATPTPVPSPTATPTPPPTPTPTPASTPTPSATPSPTPTTGSPNTTVDLGNVIVTFKVSSDWVSGFQADVVIENKTSAVINDWSLTLNLDREIVGPWNAQIASRSGNAYTFDAQPYTWNKNIPARGKVSFGFVGSPGALKQPPTNFSFRPTGGSGPTPTPTPTATPTPSPSPSPSPTPSPSPSPSPSATPRVSRFSIEDATVEEPAQGTATVLVTVKLDPTASTATGVMYQTKNGSATSGSDYTSTSGSLLFEPGTSSKTIPVTISADSIVEGMETFTVELTTATGGEIARSIATVTIKEKTSGSAQYAYGEALQKSLFFYDAQRSGKLPANFRVNWRGDSALTDGSDVGIDLSGGYYDAGDHVKFGLPMTSTITLLAWGGIEYGAAYQSAGQKAALLDAVRWGTDWIMKAHPSDNVFYAQVGNGVEDHKFWGPPEVMTMARPSFKVDTTKPGSDVAGEAAASLAAASILFKTEDPAYSAKLLSHARALYAFAYNYQGSYTNSIPESAEYYRSYSGYFDELVWAGAWLYRATNETDYLQKAESVYNQKYVGASLKWTHAWDDKIYGAIVLLSELTGKETYKTATQKWLDFWSVGNNGSRIAYTSGGLAWLDRWGSLRYSATTSFLAFVYADKVGDIGTRYRDFAKGQMNYMLGSNPNNRSYVVGFGNNAPINPHHRAAHGSWNGNEYVPVNNRHALYGALVGGPSSANDNAYADDRHDYVANEVALDYNAGFTGALARMYSEFGGAPLSSFPVAETPDDQFFVEASINQQGAGFTEIRALINNRSSFPARASDKLTFRYYVDLTELFAAGYNETNVTVKSNYTQGGVVSGLKVYDAARKIYYVDVDFSGTRIAPGSGTSFWNESQFRMTVTNGVPATAWNPANDPSYVGLPTGSNNVQKTDLIPVFENGQKLSGRTP